MVKLDEADHVAAAAATIAVEQVFVRVHQKARFVIGMQWTKSHEAPAGDAPDWLPIMGL
jgi:hypothetical protein